jgi:calcium/calmodulin-dependent 3',5'-cyclic nucleotide phosphodiesterase
MIGSTTTGHATTASDAKRRRAMKAAMSDITPSSIADDEDSDDDMMSLCSDDEEEDNEVINNTGKSDDAPSLETAVIIKRGSDGILAKTRWSKIMQSMTPLMRWIAQGKKKRVEHSEQEEGSFHVRHLHSDVHRRSLEDIGKADLSELRKGADGGADGPHHFKKEKSKHHVKRQSSHANDGGGRSTPKCLEIALPVIRDMKDETVEPVQQFFEKSSFDAWEFNVFELEDLTKNHSLWFLGMILFEHYKIIDIFKIKSAKLSNFLLEIEKHYQFDPDVGKGKYETVGNPYHNHVHAADVLQTTAHFCTTGPVQKRLRVIHGFAMFVAAMGHDYRHPGVTNLYLINTQDPLAITYNDISVLENFHAAELFKVLLSDETNILSGMDNKELRTFRNLTVKTILATDLAAGFEFVGKFKGHVQTGHAFDSDESKLLLMQMLMKVADVSHPCKPWVVHCKWSDLISEEFHRLGDREIERGMPVSPLCGRTGFFLPKSQCDFVDFVVRPCVEVFSEYCKTQLWTSTLTANYNTWKRMVNAEKKRKEEEEEEKKRKAAEGVPGGDLVDLKTGKKSGSDGAATTNSVPANKVVPVSISA